MEIHFYEKKPDRDMYVDYITTDKAIEDKVEFIETTQMHLLSTGLLLNGYRVFSHYAKGDVYEVELYKSRTPNHVEITRSSDRQQIFVLYGQVVH